MKIIVLGGAGDIGSRVVEDIAGQSDVTHITIADRNEAAALQLKLRVSKKSSAQIDVAVVDAFHNESMVRAIKGHDVCASALGPFHLFEVRCCKAAIEAGAMYCSVCDDYNAASDVIDQLHDKARAAGLLCVTGFGATPGISNMCVKFLADTMDYATDVTVSCFQPLNAGGGEAVLRHMLFVMTGMLPVWKDGAKVDVPACGTSRVVTFPKFGAQRLWPMGHAEPVTLHRYMPSLRNVSFEMGFGTGSQLFVWPAFLGLFRFAWVVTATVWLFGWLDALFKMYPKGAGALNIEVRGIRSGQPCREFVCGVAEMRESTGLSLAVGALMLGRRQGVLSDAAAKGGVYAPEGAMDPKVFLRNIMRKNFSGFFDLEMTRPFTEEELM